MGWASVFFYPDKVCMRNASHDSTGVSQSKGVGRDSPDGLPAVALRTRSDMNWTDEQWKGHVLISRDGRLLAVRANDPSKEVVMFDPGIPTPTPEPEPNGEPEGGDEGDSAE